MLLRIDRTMNRKNTELTTSKEFFGSINFSTREGNDASRTRLKEICTTSESNSSLVSENALPVVESLLPYDNENDTGVKIHVSSKDVKFQWDLNISMDECEEPFVQDSVDDNIANDLTRLVTEDNKLASENTQYDCNGSEDFPDDQKHPDDGDNMMKVQKDFDSPLEDGELRRSPAHDLKENEVEKWETECVDFEFDGEYEDDFDTCDNVISENFVVDHDDSEAMVKTSSLAEKNVDAVSDNDMIKCVKDASSEPSSLLGLKTPDGHQPGSGKKMFTIYTKRHRSVDVGESFSRTERNFSSEKMMGRDGLTFQGSERSKADYRWVDESARGDRDSRNKHGYTRSRNVIDDSDGKPSRRNIHDQSRSISYGPWDLRRFINRRQPPTERRDSCRSHSRTKPRRDRSRDRSRFIPQGFRRGPQDEYHEPGPYYLGRKERKFSPSFNSDYFHIPRTHKRSLSKSRSVSPISWNMDNRDRKRHNPKILTEDQVQGERLRFQNRSFSGECDQGIMSPPRGRRLSPQHSSRYLDNRKCMDGMYRERRSFPPARMFRQNPSFDSTGYPERLMSDRFPQMPNGRGPRNFDETSDVVGKQMRDMRQ